MKGLALEGVAGRQPEDSSATVAAAHNRSDVALAVWLMTEDPTHYGSFPAPVLARTEALAPNAARCILASLRGLRYFDSNRCQWDEFHASGRPVSREWTGAVEERRRNRPAFECPSRLAVRSGIHGDFTRGFHTGISTSTRIKERSDADPALVLARHRIGVQCRIGASLDSSYFECPDNLLASGRVFPWTLRDSPARISTNHVPVANREAHYPLFIGESAPFAPRPTEPHPAPQHPCIPVSLQPGHARPVPPGPRLTIPCNRSHNMHSITDRVSWGNMMNRGEIQPPLSAGGCDIDSMLLLSMIPGLGPRTLRSLLQRFGSAKAALSASAADLGEVRGVGAKLIHAIEHADHHVDVDAILAWCRENQTQLVCRGTPEYPSLLDQLGDAPPILFVRGGFASKDQLAVAIVGTRHATTYGLKQAHRFGHALSQAGVTVVSGLARGVDAAAHRGALEAEGRTIAVLGSGMARLYPPEHDELAGAIAAHGAVVSEYAPKAKPRSGMFPQRNRLISGLALATLVVEAPQRSGALITARLAMEQNREVLALPGPITSRASCGCNQLIRDGARLIQSVENILDELGPMHQPVEVQGGHTVRSGSELALNEIERMVLDSISPGGSLIDHVIQSSGLSASRVIASISVLEMRRLVRRLGGQTVARI